MNAAASSEDADEADFLNSESEHSDEEELNPDDFSEDVSCTLCFTLQTVWNHSRGTSSPACVPATQPGRSSFMRIDSDGFRSINQGLSSISQSFAC